MIDIKAMAAPPSNVHNLSKSKLLAFRQCPKRLWLELHRADLREDSAAAQASFEVGHQVGEIARRIYDPEGMGVTVDVRRMGVAGALAESAVLMSEGRPVFEAGLAAGGAVAFADVMIPSRKGSGSWRMVEVKSSTSVKPYHRDDVAVQAFVARESGLALESVALAHIDSSWVYAGGDDYAGLLVETDLSELAFSRADEVRSWISDAQAIAASNNEPSRASGSHCKDPYECGFLTYCQSSEPKAEYPVSVLPRVTARALKEAIEAGASDLRDVEDNLLNDRQLRVKTHTLLGEAFFDEVSAAAALAPHPLPAYFLDFETTQFAVPIWKGTRPYQQIPFQFSLHAMAEDGALEHRAFLDLSGDDPSRPFAEELLASCGLTGAIFVYSAAFEKSRISELGARFLDLRDPLQAINARVVDLLPVAQNHYYHPSQEGSWSIKKVLPAIAPDLSYAALDGIQDGGMAMSAFQEAISESTSAERRAEIDRQLRDYCRLDTYAMVRLWEFFVGRNDPSRRAYANAP